jgi:hypothetical protein
LSRIEAPFAKNSADDYPELLKIVEDRVKPQRLALPENNSTAKHRRKYWWQFSNRADDLLRAIDGKTSVLAISRTTAHLAFAFVPSDIVLSERLVVVSEDTYAAYCLLQSSIHDAWSFRPGTMTQGTTRAYFVAEAFETFPFPSGTSLLESYGKGHCTYRHSIMQAHQKGLTQVYNRFHNPADVGADITELRRLHSEMDSAVSIAYGWEDLDLGHDFHVTKQGIRYSIRGGPR